MAAGHATDGIKPIPRADRNQSGRLGSSEVGRSTGGNASTGQSGREANRQSVGAHSSIQRRPPVNNCWARQQTVVAIPNSGVTTEAGGRRGRPTTNMSARASARHREGRGHTGNAWQKSAEREWWHYRTTLAQGQHNHVDGHEPTCLQQHGKGIATSHAHTVHGLGLAPMINRQAGRGGHAQGPAQAGRRRLPLKKRAPGSNHNMDRDALAQPKTRKGPLKETRWSHCVANGSSYNMPRAWKDENCRHHA